MEAILARNAIDAMVIEFMDENILARFGYPTKIVTHNTQVFKSTKFINLCQNYDIILGHSITYYQ